MKRKVIFISLLAAVAGSAFADRLTGTVADEKGRPVELATVVALRDSLQQGVAVVDSAGHYIMELPAGRYGVRATMVGFEPAGQSVEVAGDTRLDFSMKAGGVVMDAVEVRASAIRREADRYVMTVENMPSAIGKDGKELLKEAPGVWISGDNLSINGRNGAKVYVDNRELKMDGEQLMEYLSSLKAEDVSKVEVVPYTGAEYSADMASGVILITMKRNRADGVMGNAGLSAAGGENDFSLKPSASVNVKKGKWTFSFNGYAAYDPIDRMDKDERTVYSGGTDYTASTRTDADNSVNGSALAGLFFDPDYRNSFGLEVSYYQYKSPELTVSDAVFDRMARADRLSGRYGATERGVYFNATFNYLHRLDSIGSVLKLIASYNLSDAKRSAHNSLVSRIGEEETRDSVSRSRERSLYNVGNLSLDFDKHFGQKWTFSAGAKMTINDMDNDAWYRYVSDSGEWVSALGRDYDERYTERIYALYAKATARFGRLSVSAGLRGELTDADSRGGDVEQNYTDLFPNATLTYLLDGQGTNMLTLNYARYVSRPSFWALKPARQQLSDFFYQTGNPDLNPSYQHSVSLTGVVKGRYSLTLWLQVLQDQIINGTIPDSANSDNVLFTMVNADRMYLYGASLSLPLQLTKWWTLNANANVFRMGSRLTADGELLWHPTAMVWCSSGFTLPKDFYAEVSYGFQSRVRQGEVDLRRLNMLGLSLKKTFAGKRWTVSVSVDNLLSSKMDLKLRSAGYTNHLIADNPASFKVSATYNFNAGKMFGTKEIERNADESRFSKSGLGN